MSDAVVLILHEDVVGIAGTTHKLTRDANVGVGNSHANLILGSLACLAQGLGHSLAVIDKACCNTSRNGLSNNGFDVDYTAFDHSTHGYGHLGRTDIDGYDIFLYTIHNILFFSIFSIPMCPAATQR